MARLAKIALGLGVSVALLAWVFRGVDVRAVGARLADTHWGWLGGSVAALLLSIWARAWRWRYLFAPGARPRRLFAAVMIGYTGNNLLPLRAGEVLRAYVVARHGQPFWATLATLVVERVLDAIAVGLMLAVLFLTLAVPRELEWAALVFLSADLVLLALLAALAAAPGRVVALARRLTGWWPAGACRVDRALDLVLGGLAGIGTPRHLPPILAGSLVVWLLLAVSVWTAFRAARLDLPMAAAWAVLAFVGLGVSLPSSPGFAGVIQAAVVLALALFAVPQADALSFSLLLHGSQFLPVTLWGLALLLVEQVSLGEAARGVGAPARGR